MIVQDVVLRVVGLRVTVTTPATDVFWGDRYGMVTDPFGHSSSFATHVKDMAPEEKAEAVAKAFG